MSERVLLARKIITDIIYINLATTDAEGAPWNTPVFTAHDDQYKFYWVSAFDARHSKNIRENAKVAATIYDSRIEEGRGEAVYMEGQAEELAPDTWTKGLETLRGRAKLADTYFSLEQFQSLGEMRVYRFVPNKFYMLRPDGADIRMPIDMFES